MEFLWVIGLGIWVAMGVGWAVSIYSEDAEDE